MKSDDKNKIKREIYDCENALYYPKEHGNVRKVRDSVGIEERIWLFERIKKLKQKLLNPTK